MSNEELKPFTTRLSPALIRRLKKWAVDHDMSLQEAATLAYEDLLKKKMDPRGGSTKTK